ncbi:hypothetical protein OEB99_13105 [Actinotalea sp. M2MS4P-6]|uniref:hypothetical protein n=1 Tax=Actinotalea sp. M2MS4P-6 TaxID=2983762 RepID=UPI0021E508D5|nr:hypothetical protein [Actinotalea sp. M2MS4P-6]MCV2395250.1 hypothetical protein [Actinotalea sp. M2MS4P-6]
MLTRLLSVDFPGVEALRTQVEEIHGVELNCTCGCPSITPIVDRDAAPPAHGRSQLPVELAEMSRRDGVERSVLCFVDAGGYLGNLECVYYDDPKAEWPDPADCAVLLEDEQGYTQAVQLPGGALVRPQDPNDRWTSFGPVDGGRFCATTFTGYRECFAPDGTLASRTSAK